MMCVECMRSRWWRRSGGGGVGCLNDGSACGVGNGGKGGACSGNVGFECRVVYVG